MTDEAAFFPAVSRRRFAGWTPVRQTEFIAVLARGHGVCDAAAAAGLSQRSAYQLRRHPSAGGFHAAWDAALDAGRLQLSDTALERALNGEREPVFYRGKAIGERIVHNDRLLISLLREQYRKAAAARRREPATPLAAAISLTRKSEACEVTAPVCRAAATR